MQLINGAGALILCIAACAGLAALAGGSYILASLIIYLFRYVFRSVRQWFNPPIQNKHHYKNYK
ncbi:hypothetical protein [Spirosoma sordidisoli]|uniref:Uncharacterized protein n=1 Tax=Spirosoma sordidisoli TaxID=2502893 RepID=A0A4Q2UN43_9BACT|nr:hypothetical protein [Spirosoma sordidisoli]RYC70736.1 hypothetical protein EQG79_00860 [Spirosoma sordidisoli]